MGKQKKGQTVGQSDNQIKHFKHWSFPTVSACPRCKSTNTVAVSTQGRVQYRKCRQAVCRQPYHVMGSKVN